VAEVAAEADQAVARLEAGEDDLVDGDRHHPGERHPERVPVEQRHAQQREREQDEIDRDAEDGRAVGAGLHGTLLARGDGRF
jgi:hypothetical protein